MITWDKPVGGFRGPQVCQLAGITYRQLDYWDRIGLVTPSVCVARGSGSARRYSLRDVLQLAVIRHLTDVGLSLPSVRKHFGLVQAQLPEDPDIWDDLIVVWTEVEMRVISEADDLLRVVKTTNGSIALLPLAVLAQRLRAAAASTVSPTLPGGGVDGATGLGAATRAEGGPATAGACPVKDLRPAPSNQSANTPAVLAAGVSNNGAL